MLSFSFRDLNILIMVVLNSLIIPTCVSYQSGSDTCFVFQIVFFLPFDMPCKFFVECQMVSAVVGNRNCGKET